MRLFSHNLVRDGQKQAGRALLYCRLSENRAAYFYLDNTICACTPTACNPIQKQIQPYLRIDIQTFSLDVVID